MTSLVWDVAIDASVVHTQAILTQMTNLAKPMLEQALKNERGEMDGYILPIEEQSIDMEIRDAERIEDRIIIPARMVVIKFAVYDRDDLGAYVKKIMEELKKWKVRGYVRSDVNYE